MDTVRFAVVGCGNISRAHIHAIRNTPGAELAAVVDVVEARAREVAESCGCAWYTSVEAMLAESAVDAVDICTASGLHLEPALAAARAGKHVLVEKPLEVTPARCDAMIEACEQHGVLLGGVFQSRFLPANMLVKDAAAAGHFGRLILGNAEVKWFRPTEYYAGSSWRGTWRYDGGGALMNQGIHQVDLLLWVMGKATAVQAVTRRLIHQSIEVEDLAVAMVHFADGAVGVIEASTAITPGYPKRLEIHGSAGGAVIENDVLLQSTGIPDSTLLVEAREGLGDTSTFADPMAMPFLGHERQIADFVDAIRTGRQPAVSGREARRAVALVTAVYQSARTGALVQLDDN